MYLEPFYNTDGEQITISALQGSRFAKEVADDFNPLHNPDSKRFCVPGDLLFSLVLANYGVSQKMAFQFKGMVSADTPLNFTPTDAAQFTIHDAQNKVYLEVERSGEQSRHAELIKNLTQRYVAFSGQNFPHTLQPLLAANKVMINPERPMVIYERMAFEINDLNCTQPVLTAADAHFTVKGKRGTADLNFIIKNTSNTVIGSGFKRLIVSGLKPYDEAIASALVQTYLDIKAAYQQG